MHRAEKYVSAWYQVEQIFLNQGAWTSCAQMWAISCGIDFEMRFAFDPLNFKGVFFVNTRSFFGWLAALFVISLIVGAASANEMGPVDVRTLERHLEYFRDAELRAQTVIVTAQAHYPALQKDEVRARQILSDIERQLQGVEYTIEGKPNMFRLGMAQRRRDASDAVVAIDAAIRQNRSDLVRSEQKIREYRIEILKLQSQIVDAYWLGLPLQMQSYLRGFEPQVRYDLLKLYLNQSATGTEGRCLVQFWFG